jgi:lipopolysaccharide export system permease protein
MRIINYLGWNLLKGILLVALLLLGIDLFFYFINELRFVGTGDYNFVAVCEFVLLTIPRKIYLISPWAALLGSLLVLGSMAKNNELLFIRTIGVSVNKIALYGGYYIMIFTVSVFIFGELLAPKIEAIAQQRKTLALSKGKAVSTANGMWVRAKNKFIHITKVKDPHTLTDVTVFDLDENLKLKTSSFASVARLSKNSQSDNQTWELQDVIITDFSRVININNNELANQNNRISSEKLATKTETNLLDLNILKVAGVKHLERLSIKNLLLTIKDRLANNLTVIEYQIAFWKKIVQPFSILIMSYLAVPFVMGPLRSCSRGLRLLVGVAVGASFYLLNSLFCPLVTVINFPASIAAILPAAIFLCIGVCLAVKV